MGKQLNFLEQLESKTRTKRRRQIGDQHVVSVMPNFLINVNCLELHALFIFIIFSMWTKLLGVDNELAFNEEACKWRRRERESDQLHPWIRQIQHLEKRRETKMQIRGLIYHLPSRCWAEKVAQWHFFFECFSTFQTKKTKNETKRSRVTTEVWWKPASLSTID